MQLADDKLGVNWERKVEKIVFVCAKRLFIQEQNVFFTFPAQSTPLCHMTAAGAKRHVDC
jgi:hypothetical protein